MQGRDFESLDVGGILVGEVEGNEREEELRLFYLGKEGPLHQGVRVVVLGVKYYIGHCFLVLNDVLQVVDVKWVYFGVAYFEDVLVSVWILNLRADHP